MKYGVNVRDILKICKRYIHIGNLDMHSDDPEFKFAHTEIEFPYLITKKMNPYTDRIFIWGDDGMDEFEKNNGLKHFKVSYEVEGHGMYTTEFVASDISAEKLFEYGYYWMKLDVEEKFKGIKVVIPENTFKIQKI